MKPILKFNAPVLNALSTAVTQTSSIQDISDVKGFSVHSVLSGTPTGTLEIKGGNTSIVADFVVVATHAIAIAATHLDNFPEVHYTKFLVKFTSTGGAGSITSTASAKEI